MTPKPPFTATPAVTPEGPVSLVQDATGHILCAAFTPSDASLIVTNLNRACPPRDPQAYNPYISAMLAALRLRLEHELGEPLTDQPLPIGDVFSTMADWFGFNTGERAIAIGPATIAYMALQGDSDTIPLQTPVQRGELEGGDGRIRIITTSDAIYLAQAA